MRVINLDWLEVYVIEPLKPVPDAQFFRSCGLQVEERSYGTRQYNSMFTILQNGVPLIEVRRDPLSKKSLGGIMHDKACHLRLPNRMLYTRYPVQTLINFINCYGYEFKNVTRFDIAMDFPRFDSGLEVQTFINMYMRGEVAKIHQSKLAMFGIERNHPKDIKKEVSEESSQGDQLENEVDKGWNVGAHGQDSWTCRDWNSLKWGAPSSAVSTKLYNKTIELDRVGHDKPYIREQWEKVYPGEKEMWRIEFSIKSSKRHVVQRDTGELFEIKLEELASKDMLQFTFFSFFSEYFDFRLVKETRNGTKMRKDLCPMLDLFKINPREKPFLPLTVTNKKDAGRTGRALAKYLKELIARCEPSQYELARSAGQVLMYLQYENSRTGTTDADVERAWERINSLQENKPFRLVGEI